MPRSAGSQWQSAKSKKCTKLNSVANVNSNHSSTNSDRSEYSFNNRKTRNGSQIKSKVVVPDQRASKSKKQENSIPTEQFIFEEDGETIQMEISDGRAAAVEFASEDEQMDTGNESESDSDDESFRHQPDSSNEMELGELPDKSDEESQVVEPPAEEDGVRPAKVTKTAKQDSKAKRQSVEARLDMLSSTLLAVKELLTKSGITGEGITDDRNKKETEGKKNSGKVDYYVMTTNSQSETTIYQNSLNQTAVSPEQTIQVVDEEISFKKNNQPHTERFDQFDKINERDSSSSEERIDTSDELIDMEMDVHDKFIADCASEERRHKQQQPGENREQQQCNEAIERSDNMIREAKAAKIRVIF